MTALKDSGNQCNDPVEDLRRTHLTVRKGVVMSGGPVYYLIKVCEEHPAVDQAFVQVLDSSLLSESDKPIDVDAYDKKKGSSTDQKLIEALEKSSIAIESNHKREEERITGEETRRQEEMVSQKWDEYLKLSDTIDKLREGSNIQLLFNFTKRVHEAEKAIGIDNKDSIVANIIDPHEATTEQMEQTFGDE